MKSIKMFTLHFSKILFLLLLCLQANSYAFRFVVYADSRAPRNDPLIFNHAVLGYINSQVVALDPLPDFVLFLGDMVNRGVNTTYTQSYLSDWLAFMQAGLGSIPIYTAVGNTDLYGNTGWIEYPVQAFYQAVFSYLPDNGPTNYKKLAYSFEYGQGQDRSLFVVLDAFGFVNQGGVWVGLDNAYAPEQINWFAQQAAASTAPLKFLLTHGPAFSVEGFPVDSSVTTIWSIMLENNFNMFYCGHEHIFSRWLRSVTQTSTHRSAFIQTIVGSAGATPDNPANVKVDPQQAHIYSGYTFVVVDVENGNFVQHAYKVVPTGSSFITQNLDELVSISTN